MLTERQELVLRRLVEAGTKIVQLGYATTGGDVQAFLGQDVNALERVATEFARALVSAILEAF